VISLPLPRPKLLILGCASAVAVMIIGGREPG
jgi:hypothetical protein